MTVTVVLCTYNGAKFLGEQLDSLLRQTYPIEKIIIQDDGSTDATCDIARDYASRDSRIVVCHNEGEHGVNGNFFSAMQRATTDLIAICDQDDIWEEDKIARQVEAIGENLATGGPTIPFSGDGSAVHREERMLNTHILRLLFVSMMPGHAMLIRRELLDLVTPAREFYYDSILQMVAAAAGRLNAERCVHVHQRRYAGAVTYTAPTDASRSATNMLRYLFYCFRIYRATRPFMRERMEAWQRIIAPLPFDTEEKRLALTMANLQRRDGMVAYLRLTAFCFRHRHHLFHTIERDTLALRLRALLFPITSAYYLRTKLPK